MLLALALSVAWRAPHADAASTRPAPRFDARTVYLRDCATCHGAQGEGTPQAPQIADAGAALTDYELTTGRMPISEPDDPVHRHRPRYSPAQIDALVDHVSAFGGSEGEPVPTVDLDGADTARGGELYRLTCAACNTWSGMGGALYGR
jgi:ubiquinol-cytochrome c reductase cytochrome c subunit